MILCELSQFDLPRNKRIKKPKKPIIWIGSSLMFSDPVDWSQPNPSGTDMCDSNFNALCPGLSQELSGWELRSYD